MGKPLCEVEEQRAKTALNAIDDALKTLRTVLDEVENGEEENDAGTD